MLAVAVCPIRVPELHPHLGGTLCGGIEEVTGVVFLGVVSEVAAATALRIFVVWLQLRFDGVGSVAIEELVRVHVQELVDVWHRRLLGGGGASGRKVVGGRRSWRGLPDLVRRRPRQL